MTINSWPTRLVRCPLSSPPLPHTLSISLSISTLSVRLGLVFVEGAPPRSHDGQVVLFISKYTYMRTHAYASANEHARAHAHAESTHKHTHKHAHMHGHTQPHTCTHTQTCICKHRHTNKRTRTTRTKHMHTHWPHGQAHIQAQKHAHAIARWRSYEEPQTAPGRRPGDGYFVGGLEHVRLSQHLFSQPLSLSLEVSWLMHSHRFSSCWSFLKLDETR